MSENRDRYLEAAHTIAMDLCRDAFWSGESCTWLGWAINKVQRGWPKVYRSLEAELYGGSSGVLLFLATIYPFSPNSMIRRTIEGAVNQVLASSDKFGPNDRYGFYVGRAGNAYALWRAGCLLERSDWIEFGIREFHSLQQVPPDPRNLDMISGSAGTILSLLQCARMTKDKALVDIALTHGESLALRAERTTELVSWDTSAVEGQGNLTGLSHGAAGIGVAILEIYEETRDEKWLKLALGAFEYERMHFDREAGNWWDLRLMPGETPHTKRPSCFMAWCHGAPGIGLARLRQVSLLPDHQGLRDDLAIAIATTLKTLNADWVEGQDNFSLCHGQAGNADFLLSVGITLNRPDLISAARSIGDRGIREILDKDLPWPCGNGGAGETPNLMLGTAGIGYFYLRLYDPVSVPSVLLISPE